MRVLNNLFNTLIIIKPHEYTFAENTLIYIKATLSLLPYFINNAIKKAYNLHALIRQSFNKIDKNLHIKQYPASGNFKTICRTLSNNSKKLNFILAQQHKKSIEIQKVAEIR